MPLTYDYTAVEGSETLTDDERVTMDSLIWATMAVGINTITVENAREFYTRVSLWEKVIGAYRQRVDEDTNQMEPLYLTPEDVLRFVGLRTNASPITKAKFRTHVYETHERYNVPSSVGV